MNLGFCVPLILLTARKTTLATNHSAGCPDSLFSILLDDNITEPHPALKYLNLFNGLVKGILPPNPVSLIAQFGSRFP
jgi:hypothetical protein